MVAAVLLVLSWMPGERTIGDEPFIARLTVDGVIFSDRDRAAALTDLIDDNSAKALLVHINSPGGSMVGGEDLYRGLRRVAEKKPVVIVMDEFAASGGYFVALGGDWIIAHEGTVTGSIGVIFQNSEFSELLAKLGIKTDAVRSGDLKARPSPFEKISPAARQVMRDIVDGTRNYFLDLVVERRAIEESARRIIADGRILGGRQAIELGLVDAIGDEREAVAWLERERGIAKGLPVHDLKTEPEQELWERFLDTTLQNLVGKTVIPERVRLDGLVSLWHAALR